MSLGVNKVVMILYYYAIKVKDSMMLMSVIYLDAQPLCYKGVCFFPLAKIVNVQITYCTMIRFWPIQ